MSRKTSESKSIDEAVCKLRTTILPSNEVNKKDPSSAKDFSDLTDILPSFTEDTLVPLAETKVEKKRQILKCFVMMPFGSQGEYDRGNIESDFIYKYIICAGIEKLKQTLNVDVYVIREVDKSVAGSITKSILKNIALADICIVDITGRNPNVFFELGIRYCLRDKVTILLRQEITQIPFDIIGFRCITYDSFKPGSAINSIAEYLISGIKEQQFPEQ